MQKPHHWEASIQNPKLICKSWKLWKPTAMCITPLAVRNCTTPYLKQEQQYNMQELVKSNKKKYI